MRRFCILLSFLLLAALAWPQGFIWEKKGILGGTIQDLLHDTHRGRFLLASDAGLFVSEDTLNWLPDNTGLYDLSIVNMAWMPLDATRSLYVVLAWDGVYAKASDWMGWRYADETGLTDPVGGMTYSYADVRAVALFHDGTAWQVAVAVPGAGVAFRSFDPSSPAAPWGTQWAFDAAYLGPPHFGNPYIAALQGIKTPGADRLLVATHDMGPGYPGQILYKSGSQWTKVLEIAGTDFLSLGADPLATSPDVLAGTAANGVYHSSNSGSNWSRFCGFTSNSGPWWDVAVLREGGASRFAGTTGMELFKLDPAVCTAPYLSYSQYVHYAQTLAVEGGDALLVGTFGMGLWRYPAPDQEGSPRGHTGTNALQMRNVSDIAIALSASRPDAPPVIFTASETEGLYKCFSLNYCTRYFFAPLPNQPGGVSGRSVALVPGYDEYGEIRYVSEGRILASQVAAGGVGYALGDTGSVSGCGDGTATYAIDAVSDPEGIVQAYHIEMPGAGYDTQHNPCATSPGGDQPGIGSGLTITITAVDFDTAVGAKTLYLGTGRNGLFRSDNGGASWKKLVRFPINPFTGAEYEIVKVAVAPDFNATTPSTNDKHMFVLTREGAVLWSVDGGEHWTVDRPVDYSSETGNVSSVAADLVISPAYNRLVPAEQKVFIATNLGIFQRTWDGGAYLWNRLTALNQPVLSMALSPCFGLPSCPGCLEPGCALEQNTILAGTKNGIYVSIDRGGSFQPVLDPSCPGPGTTIPELALHPKADLGNPTRRLLTYGVKHSFDITGSDQPLLFYLFWSNQGAPHWQCVNADPSDPPLPAFSDYMIRALAFSPVFGSGGNAEVFAGHDYAAMWRALHPPQGPQAWQRLDGFYNTPQRVNAIAECPLSYWPTPVVLAGTENYGVMISFDGGESYFPWGYGFEASYGGKLRTLHNAEAVACTELFYPTQEPYGYNRFLASGSDCLQFTGGICTEKTHHGILWGDFEDPTIQTRWQRSLWTDGSTPPAPMDTHQVTELRWCPSAWGSPFPVQAADRGVGALYSNPYPDPWEDPPPPDDGHHWGEVWQLEVAGEAPTDLADITCQNTEPVRSSGGPVPRDARGSFIWGAQSGLTQGRMAVGTAKFKPTANGSWQSCSGLSATANWRSILMLASQTVLIGDQGSDSTPSVGIFRNTQDGSTCTLWEEANTGMEGGDTPGVTEDYSKKIIAFAQVANGILAAMEEDKQNNLEGGIFFSDTASDGAAWVPVNAGMTCTSNYEVVNGSSIYTGSTCDGVYATTAITYDGYPAAKFAYAISSDPWYENRILFTDLSAGLPTGRAWDFDGDGQDDASPAERTVVHDYWVSGSGAFNPRLTAFKGTQSDTYRLSDDGLGPVPVTNTHIPRLRREVEGTDEYITIYWNRISGSGHTYHVWASPNAAGWGRTELAAVADGTSGSGTGYTYDCTGDPCWLRYLDESPFSEMFYKLQTTW